MRRPPAGLTTLLSRDFAHSKNNETVSILSLTVIGLSRSTFSTFATDPQQTKLASLSGVRFCRKSRRWRHSVALDDEPGCALAHVAIKAQELILPECACDLIRQRFD